MTPTKRKIFFIMIPIIILLIIAIAVIFLYLTTDFLKSNKTLFYKYAMQNVETIFDIIDLESEQEYSESLKQSPYTTNADFTIKYTQNADTSEEDTSNEINNLVLTIEGQTDDSNNYNYKNIDLTYDDQSLFELEYIQEGDTYGIRFSDIVRQFLAVENHDLKEVAQKSGLTEDEISSIPDSIPEIDWYSLLQFTDEEIEQLKDTYSNIIMEYLSSATYTKQSNALITVNGQDVVTNAYTLTITEEQQNNIIIGILEQLRDDSIILDKLNQFQNSGIVENIDLTTNFTQMIDEQIEDIKNNNISTVQIKYTVYQSQGQTVRTTIEKEVETIVIDLNNTETTAGMNIQKTIANSEQEDITTISISKNSVATSVTYQQQIGSSTTSFEFLKERSTVDQEINNKIYIKYQDSEQNKTEATYTEKINIVSTIQKSVELDDTNRIILNNYESEQLTTIFDLISEQLNQKLIENEDLINSISSSILPQDEEIIEIENNDQLSELEINRFNARFEFYTGEDIDYDDISALIEVVKGNLSTAQVSYSEDETSTTSSKQLQSIRLTLERNTENEELANTVLDLIEKNKTYTVTLQYDETTGIAQYITITVNS